MSERTVFLKVLLLLCFLLPASLCSGSAACNSGDRYEDNLNGTVTDCRTGLIWLKNAYCTATSGGIDSPGFLDWASALRWVAGLGNGICGLSDGSSAGDWRLPTKTEWMAMVANARKRVLTGPALTNGAGTAIWTEGDVFSNVQPYNYINYWSSTPYSSDPTWVWIIHIYDGTAPRCNKADQREVWPVRGGQVGSFGYLFVE